MLNCHNQRQNLCWTGLGTSGSFLLTFEANYLRAAWGWWVWNSAAWPQQSGRGWGLVLFFSPCVTVFPTALNHAETARAQICSQGAAHMCWHLETPPQEFRAVCYKNRTIRAEIRNVEGLGNGDSCSGWDTAPELSTQPRGRCPPGLGASWCCRKGWLRLAALCWLGHPGWSSIGHILLLHPGNLRKTSLTPARVFGHVTQAQVCKERSQGSLSLLSHPVHRKQGKELPEQISKATEAAQLELWTDSEVQKEVETNVLLNWGENAGVSSFACCHLC